MSVDPTQPSDPDPTPPKPSPADPGGESAETFRQKRRFKRGGDETEEGGEKPDAAIEILSSLLQDLVAKKEQRPTAPEPVPGPSKAAKYHRLSKKGSGGPASAEAGPTPAEASAPTAGVPSGTAPASAPPAAAFRPAPTFDPEARRLRVWKTLALLSLLALLGLVGYVVWSARAASDRNASGGRSAPPAAGAWTDTTLSQLDRVLAADQAGDLKGAQRLAAAITPPDTDSPPGLAIYLANLQTRLERTYDAEADLLRLLKSAPPERTAAVEAALGFNFSRTRDYEKATEAYKTGVSNDPFSASLFYYGAEAARHTGHLPEAVANFRRALDRVPAGQPELASLRECINFKLRLCAAERGQEAEFQTDMDEQLKAPAPSGYWLLTAAAVALQHQNLPTAADLLGRARAALGPASFESLLNDYLFRAYSDRKELAEFFPEPTTRRAKLLPTMAHAIEP